LLQVLNLYPILFLNVSAAMANVDPCSPGSGPKSRRDWLAALSHHHLAFDSAGLLAGAIIVFIWAFTDLGTPPHLWLLARGSGADF